MQRGLLIIVAAAWIAAAGLVIALEIHAARHPYRPATTTWSAP
mgnify:CR=1 FL=1